jgi:hypothetical protein
MDTSKISHTTRAIALCLAILGAVAATGLITGSAALAQAPPTGNETSGTPSGNATSGALTGNATTSGPSITVNPNSGGVGTNVTIAGTGFTPGQTFTFTFEKGYMLTGNMIQDTMGRFSTTALIPQNATNGSHEIEVKSNQGQTATSTFNVQSSAGNATSSSSGNATMTMPPTNATTPAGNATSGQTTGNLTIVPPSGNTTPSAIPAPSQ